MHASHERGLRNLYELIKKAYHLPLT